MNSIIAWHCFSVDFFFCANGFQASSSQRWNKWLNGGHWHKKKIFKKSNWRTIINIKAFLYHISNDYKQRSACTLLRHINYYTAQVTCAPLLRVDIYSTENSVFPIFFHRERVGVGSIKTASFKRHFRLSMNIISQYKYIFAEIHSRGFI